jgi:hypothetical protein
LHRRALPIVVNRLESCAVLFGIPVTRAEFDEQVVSASKSDYVRGLLRGRIPDAVWNSDYAPVGTAACKLISTADQLNVRVYQGATLNDFKDATAYFRSVILFGHWRGAMFRKDDLLRETDTIIERLRQYPQLRGIRPSSVDADGLVDDLNRAIENLTILDALPKIIAETGHRTRAIGQTLCRDFIDEAMRGLIVPGNRVELFDGLYSLGAMERALYCGFSGSLDLELCNSEAFATFIDLRRGNRVRHLHWPSVVHPLPQILKVEATLRIMAQYGGDYAPTRLSLEEAE